MKNESSFLYGKEPAGNVPIYALVKNCYNSHSLSLSSSSSVTLNPLINDKQTIKSNRALPTHDDSLMAIQSNEVATKAEANHRETTLISAEGNRFRKLHFHVTYWMFYPFSEGKAVCVLDLGFFGTWPIPSMGGVCLGQMKEYGNHVGDWEHMSLYFKVSYKYINL